MGKLSNKTAVITGGSSGIGLATAKRFVAEGATVYITGRREEELAKAQAEIGGDAVAMQGDIADLADLDRLWAQVKQERGSVDVIVTNAGIAEAASLPDATPEHFDKTFAINAREPFFTVQKALPLLNEGGSIVLVSGVGHRLGWPDFPAYSASKAAVRSFARSWAAGLMGRRIRVNSVSPARSRPRFSTGSTPAAQTPTPFAPHLSAQSPWAAWAGRMRSPPRSCSLPPTTAASSPERTWPSTAVPPSSKPLSETPGPSAPDPAPEPVRPAAHDLHSQCGLGPTLGSAKPLP
ncbi:probable glucose dehydrogenase (plasmid) [Rhodococcus jostii RHA1]|uniref:Probable glucose dehydrogenase n=1 Tax=Rhodococcus jostii (strain RHA1) TaxID=101510 RepID=Q0RX75_RHOJR|nr:probable glucose dehydrogenase [Rhodococcus jostii RHA1]